MDKQSINLTSAEIGTLWTEYINGTAIYIVNKYMASIIEDKKTKDLFDKALQIFENQKNQIASFLEFEGFPVPIGFTDKDLHKSRERLFSDIFCLHYLHIMTSHGLLGHISSLGSSVRKDLFDFYDTCDTEGKLIFQESIELLLEKGHFQRTPYFYPEAGPSFISGSSFLDGHFSDQRPLAATEIASLSFNIKKKIMEKTLSIGFSQAAQSKKVRKFLKATQKNADKQIQSLGKILHQDNLPVPMSWESEVTMSRHSPFSDKLMLYHIGFLLQTSQAYHGAALAVAMRSDLVLHYEQIILKNLSITKDWFDLMTKNRWLEQPPLAPDRERIAKGK
ncbi:DUF3231 family protein [Salibacterium aidingense]|uniref:DUF3231 family protein n=1 Tax=Salibacterium aidingense TaxID=384933 RepID=UPI003BC2FEFA